MVYSLDEAIVSTKPDGNLTVLQILVQVAVRIAAYIRNVGKFPITPMRILLVGDEIESRSGSNLAPLQLRDSPRGLSPFAGSINHLMERLRQALEAERNFAMNSAHEPSSPIAGPWRKPNGCLPNCLSMTTRIERAKLQPLLLALQTVGEVDAACSCRSGLSRV